MFENYLVIFDADGVLSDTGPIHFESWVKMADEIGYEFTKEFFEGTFGQQSPLITRKLVGPGIDQELVEEWASKKEIYYREMVKDKLELLPGVMTIIEELVAKGFKLAVGSSGPRENVELLVKSLNILEKFSVLITAAEIENGKPAPDVFLKASEKVYVEPENCIVIEDAPVGIEAARRAGMKSIALTTTHNEKELLDADLIVKDLSYIDISDIFKLLEIVVE